MIGIRIAFAACIMLLSMTLTHEIHAAEQCSIVTVEGSCAIEGYTAQQAQRMALRQARSLAIEQVAGVNVVSSTLVTDGRLAADFIRSFSRGYITQEKTTWLPVREYQADPSTPPIVEYRVQLVASVAVPRRPHASLGLSAKLNQSIFRAHTEPLIIDIRSGADAHIAIFNIMADDTVAMLYPYRGEPLRTGGGKPLQLPNPDEDPMYLCTLPGVNRDTEAILVAGIPASDTRRWRDVFTPGETMPLSTFFAAYMELASSGEEVVLPYEVFQE